MAVISLVLHNLVEGSFPLVSERKQGETETEMEWIPGVLKMSSLANETWELIWNFLKQRWICDFKVFGQMWKSNHIMLCDSWVQMQIRISVLSICADLWVTVTNHYEYNNLISFFFAKLMETLMIPLRKWTEKM